MHVPLAPGRIRWAVLRLALNAAVLPAGTALAAPREQVIVQLDGDDSRPAWSSRGVTQDGFAKPDIHAPGAHIVSTLAPAACSRRCARPASSSSR